MSQTLICSRSFLHILYLEGLYKTKETFFWEDKPCDLLVLSVKFSYKNGVAKQDYFGDYQFLENNQAILVLDRNREQVVEEYFEYAKKFPPDQWITDSYLVLKSSKLAEFCNV